MKTKNVLFVMKNQLFAGAMSCAGNRYLETPKRDRLLGGLLGDVGYDCVYGGYSDIFTKVLHGSRLTSIELAVLSR